MPPFTTWKGGIISEILVLRMGIYGIIQELASLIRAL